MVALSQLFPFRDDSTQIRDFRLRPDLGVIDIEAIFLFPWAVSLGKLSLFAVLEGMVFILILIAGLVYAWRKGMLEWV